jgi:hypothetical protein
MRDRRFVKEIGMVVLNLVNRLFFSIPHKVKASKSLKATLNSFPMNLWFCRDITDRQKYLLWGNTYWSKIRNKLRSSSSPLRKLFHTLGIRWKKTKNNYELSRSMTPSDQRICRLRCKRNKSRPLVHVMKPTFVTTHSTVWLEWRHSSWLACLMIFINDKKLWKELICLLSLHYTNESCPSGSRNFIIFLYLIHLRRKLNSLQRYDIAQNYRLLHRMVQRLSQHNLKISHHRNV